MSFDRDYAASRLWNHSCPSKKQRRVASSAAPADRPLHRFRPAAGTKLSLAEIPRPWLPSGTVAGAGVFALVWPTRTTDLWAPLSDFAASDQLLLIEAGGWRECDL